MAHAVQTMAYVGQTPWHQLGNQLSAKQSIEVWAQQAGMDWEIKALMATQIPPLVATSNSPTLSAA